MYRFLIFFTILFLITGCSTRSKRYYGEPTKTKKYPSSKDSYSDTVDKKEYKHATMRPYVVRGVEYFPTMVEVGDEFRGNASWYGADFHGKQTSSGEIYNMHDMTAAHKTLPMNTIVKVKNEKNGLSTVVRINDRGPFVETRIIDLSNAAAKEVGLIATGTAPVVLEILGFDTTNQKTIPSAKELAKMPQKSQLEGFALQLGAFSKFDGAVATQKKYDGVDGYNTIIKDVQIGNNRMFRVWLRGFRSEQEARDYQVSSKLKNSTVVKED